MNLLLKSTAPIELRYRSLNHPTAIRFNNFAPQMSCRRLPLHDRRWFAAFAEKPSQIRQRVGDYFAGLTNAELAAANDPRIP